MDGQGAEGVGNSRAAWAEAARHLAALVLTIATPIAMVFSNRSTAAVLVIATGLMLFAALARGSLSWLRLRFANGWAAAFAHPFLVLFAVFFLVAAFGVPLTANPAFHGWRLIEFAIPVISTGVMLVLMRCERLPFKFSALVFGLTLASLLALVELRNGAPMRSYFGLRTEDYRLNRTVVALLILLFPLAASALAVPARRVVALLAGALPVGTILTSASGAADLGLIVGCLVFLVALVAWRLTAFLVGLGMIAGVFSAPWQGIILTELISSELHERLRSTSSAIRVEIYRAFGRAVEYAPFFGSGFNSASQLEKEPAYRVIPEKLNYFLEFGHAHNAALQIWVEFGLFGAILAGFLSLATLKRIDMAPPAIRPALLAFLAASFAIALVSHGAWQAWWAGGLGIGIVLIAAIIAGMHRALPQAA